VIFEASPYAEARWIGGDKADLEDFMGKHRSQMAVDIDHQPVFLAKTAWETNYVSERYAKVRFERSKERA
jgi:peptide chain release factor 3